MSASELGPGIWWVMSDEDPRFKGSGHSKTMSATVTPKEVEEYIERRERELGTERPDDIMCSWMMGDVFFTDGPT